MSEEERLFLGKMIGLHIISMTVTDDYVCVILSNGSSKAIKNCSVDFLQKVMERVRSQYEDTVNRSQRA